MKKIGIFAGVVVVAGGVAAPWAVGLVTEQQWQEATREMNSSQPFFQVETSGYERSMFGADLKGVLSFHDPESGEVHELPYKGKASHGVTGSQLIFTADQLPDEVAALFPDEQPQVTIDSSVWGTTEVALNIPAVSHEDAESGSKVELAAVLASAVIRDNGNQADISMNWPGMVLTDPQATLEFGNLSFTQSMARLKGEVWTGTGEMSLDRIEVAPTNRPVVSVEKLAISSETKATNGDKRIDTLGQVTLANVVADGESYGPHRLEMALRDIDVDSWNQLMTAMQDLQTGSMDPSLDSQAQFELQMNAVNQMGEAARTLAANGVSVSLPVISLGSPLGAVSGDLMLSHPEVPEDERGEMMMVMEKLTGDVNLSLPLALAEAHPMLMSKLQQALDQGMLVQDGDRVVFKARLADMTVDINGRKFPLPPVI